MTLPGSAPVLDVGTPPAGCWVNASARLSRSPASKRMQEEPVQARVRSPTAPPGGSSRLGLVFVVVGSQPSVCFCLRSGFQFQFLPPGRGVQGPVRGLQAPAEPADGREPNLA